MRKYILKTNKFYNKMNMTKLKTSNQCASWMRHFGLSVILLFVMMQSFGQNVNTYTFAQSTSSPTDISTTGALLSGSSAAADDNNFALTTLPFTFTYRGVAFTTVGISANCYLKLGALTTTSYTPLSSQVNCVALMGADMYGLATGHGIYTQTIGTAPNRRFIIQWNKWGKYSSGLNEFTGQIVFYETLNRIEVNYIIAPGTTSFTAQVGLTGAAVTDFNNRTTTTNWAATTAGAANTANCTFSSTVKPPAGLTFTWSPPVTSPCSGAPNPGNTTATVTSACTGTSTTLGLQTLTAGTGVTYSWQSADDALFTTNVSSALGAGSTFTTTIGATPRYFRCAVTCTSGPTTTNSNPILISPLTPAPGNTLCTATSGCAIGPFTLSLQNTVAGSATYVWQSADDAAFTTNVTTLSSTTNTQAMTGQTSSKYYRCGVTCSGGGSPVYSTPFYLPQGLPTQCYCVPGYTYGTSSGDLISQVQITGTTLLNNSGTTTGTPSWVQYVPPAYTATNYTATLTAGNTYNCVVTIGSFSSQGVRAWIDYNDDGVFATNEAIGATATTIATAFGTGTFPITIACNPPSGTHRLRVRCAWATNGVSIDPCATYGWGETEDYLVTIAPALPCPAPSNFSANTPTINGATFAWTVGCVETDWEIEFGPTGFTPGTGTIAPVSTNPATVTIMPCGTAQDVYLRANCQANGYSTYVGPISVTTLACPCTGAPPAANTLSTVSGGCPQTPFTLSMSYNYSGLTGISYQWQSSPDNINWSNISGATAATYASAGQTATTYYRCSVTCSTGPTTTNSTPILITQNPATQCYCVPSAANTYACADGDVIAQVQILQGTTVLYTNNSGTGCPSDPTPGNGGLGANGNGVSDYTGLGSVVNMTAGNTYGFKVFCGQYSEHYTAWIDYNDDGAFGANERIGYTTVQPTGSGLVGVLGGSVTFNVTLACNPPSGVHRMRVKCAYAQTSGLVIDPCASYSFMETEDYLVTIDPALPCPAPSAFALTAASQTATGGNFNWTVGCVETDWEIEYGATGFTPGTGTIEPCSGSATNNTFNYTTTTMPCGTTLHVYLRANCQANGYSTYVGPISITTLPCPCSGAPAASNVVAAPACFGAPFTLSLSTNYSGLTGIAYAWQSSPDGINWTSTGGTAATYAATQTAATYYRCNVTCTASNMSTMATQLLVPNAPPPPGFNMANPIVIGAVPVGTPYTNTVTNTTANCYANNGTTPTNQASPDVWYQFTLACPSDVSIGLCGAGFDTYLHLLNSSGTELAYNDDNGPLCSGLVSSISQTALPAGTYYVITEGYSTNTGALPLTVVSNTSCNISLNLKCYIEGFYIGGGMMQPVLNNQGLSNPTTQCDTVIVELRNTTIPYTTAYSFTGILLTNGTLTCTFPAGAMGNSYYLVVNHRNAMQTWSAAPVLMSGSPAYDFSTAATQAYGGNQVQVATGVYAFFSGDVNQDFSIDAFDYLIMDPDIANGNGGWLATDLNGDGSVDAFDYLIYDPNGYNGITIQSP